MQDDTAPRRPTTPRRPSPTGKHEWRVTWRRRGWSPSSHNKSRVFARSADAQRFIDALRDRPDLDELSVCQLHVRPVGEWYTPGPAMARAALAAVRSQQNQPAVQPPAGPAAKIASALAAVELLRDEHLRPHIRARLLDGVDKLLRQAHHELIRWAGR